MYKAIKFYLIFFWLTVGLFHFHDSFGQSVNLVKCIPADPVWPSNCKNGALVKDGSGKYYFTASYDNNSSLMVEFSPTGIQLQSNCIEFSGGADRFVVKEMVWMHFGKILIAMEYFDNNNDTMPSIALGCYDTGMNLIWAIRETDFVASKPTGLIQTLDSTILVSGLFYTTVGYIPGVVELSSGGVILNSVVLDFQTTLSDNFSIIQEDNDSWITSGMERSVIRFDTSLNIVQQAGTVPGLGPVSCVIPGGELLVAAFDSLYGGNIVSIHKLDSQMVFSNFGIGLTYSNWELHPRSLINNASNEVKLFCDARNSLTGQHKLFCVGIDTALNLIDPVMIGNDDSSFFQSGFYATDIVDNGGGEYVIAGRIFNPNSNTFDFSAAFLDLGSGCWVNPVFCNQVTANTVLPDTVSVIPGTVVFSPMAGAKIPCNPAYYFDCVSTQTNNVITGDQIEVLPTITTRHITLKMPEPGMICNVEIRNALGSLIWVEEVHAQSEIDLENIPSGIYFINIQFHNQRFSRKILKIE